MPHERPQFLACGALKIFADLSAEVMSNICPSGLKSASVSCSPAANSFPFCAKSGVIRTVPLSKTTAYSRALRE